MLTAVTIGTVLMVAAYGSASTMYVASSASKNQVLAANMAQQVIDNARDSTYPHLLSLLGGNISASQNIPLYSYPANPATAFFPRPILRNESASFTGVYSPQALNSRFNGTVTETLTNLAPSSANNGAMRVNVNITWRDQKGPHTFSTATTIAQTGIHN